MKIGVLVKRVPDSTTKIKLKGDGSGIETSGIRYIVNPYDEYAIEAALQMVKQVKGEVVIFSFGPKKTDEAIRAALAMGADRAVRIDDSGIEGTDSYGVGRLLAAAVKAEGIELLLAGKQAIDDDAAQVPQIVAELLDWPQATVVDKIELGDGSLTVNRRVSGGAREVIEISLPAVISAEKGLNTPRFATLPNIMKAKRKPLAVKTADDLGVPPAELGASGALVKITGYRPPPERKAGRIIEGELPAALGELVRLLHEEAKVI